MTKKVNNNNTANSVVITQLTPSNSAPVAGRYGTFNYTDPNTGEDIEINAKAQREKTNNNGLIGQLLMPSNSNNDSFEASKSPAQ